LLLSSEEGDGPGGSFCNCLNGKPIPDQAEADDRLVVHREAFSRPSKRSYIGDRRKMKGE